MILGLRKILRKIFVWIFPELSKLKAEEYNFALLFSYTSNCIIDKNVKLYPVYRLNEVSIGNYTYVSENSQIQRTQIGKFCSIGPNFFCGWGIHPTNGISTSPAFYSTKKQTGKTYSDIDKFEEQKRIIIGNDVFIGMNVTVLDGVTIGDGAVIGAGSVVSKDIPPYAIAVGSPIDVIKYRFEKHQIDALLKIRWWEFPEEQLQDIEKLFFDIDTFIQKYEM